MAENFPNFMKIINPQVHEVQPIPITRNMGDRGYYSKGIITKLIKIHAKEKILEAGRGRNILYVQKSKDKKPYFWA